MVHYLPFYSEEFVMEGTKLGKSPIHTKPVIVAAPVATMAALLTGNENSFPLALFNAKSKQMMIVEIH